MMNPYGTPQVSGEAEEALTEADVVNLHELIQRQLHRRTK